MAKFEESNICPICGGRLIASPVVLTTYPCQYQATCEKCGKTFTSFHHIGFSPEQEIPGGMWCTDVQIDYNNITVDQDRSYTAFNLTEADDGDIVKNYYNGSYYEYSIAAAEEAKKDYNIDIEEVIKNQIDVDLKKKEKK